MAISQKATLKYQNSQTRGDAQKVTYSLPPKKKPTLSPTPIAPIIADVTYVKQDLIKTLVIAVAIFVLETIIWWKLRSP